jgi:hypothetical protein
VANKLKTVETDKTKRKLGMVCFSVLCNAQTLHQAALMYEDIHTLLCSPVDTDNVQRSRQSVLDAAKGIERPFEDELNEDDVQLDADEGDSDVETVEIRRSLKEQSPFTYFFKDKLSEIESANAGNMSNKNVAYSPKTFDVITSNMHVYPLWSAAMLGNLLRHCKNLSTDVSNDVARCKSNASVESHFRSVKNERFQSRLPVRPRIFVNNCLLHATSILKERLLPRDRVSTRRQTKFSKSEHCEKWSRRKRGAFELKANHQISF